MSSVGTGYREKSPVPSALSPTPQVLGANMLQDALEVGSRRGTRAEDMRNIEENGEEEAGDDSEEMDREIVDDSINGESQPANNDSGDVENPVFGARNYSATIKSVTSARQIPVYARHKIAPAPPNPPGLSATSNIPNVGGLVQNMNDLSAKTNLNASSCQSSNYSGDVPDSLVPAWPACSVSQRVKKLSWDDDDRTVDSVEVTAETMSRNSQIGNERLNLTVYF